MHFVFIVTLTVFTAAELTSSKFISPLHGRIIGGENASIESHPHQVSLQTASDHDCGGSIISENYVLTAAHCLENYTPENLTLIVRAGSTFWKSGGSVHWIESFVLHELYRVHKRGYDIAVIKVNPSFKLDETRRPIELFQKNEPAKPNAASVVTGWGTTRQEYPNQLQEVILPIINIRICKKAYKIRLPEGEICAGYDGLGGKDSCSGDSGAPLTIGGRLAGIVCWGRGCADPFYPGLYTEVAYYRDWIRNKTNI